MRARLQSRVFSNKLGLLLATSGAFTLAWVGFLAWHDIIVWGKDLILIFFGSRTGEIISLGIGMKVIHYFLIGLALLFLGSLAYMHEKMAKLKASLQIRVATATSIILGIMFITISAFYVSSFLAILGVALIFWGAIFLYITPTKQLPLELVMAAAEPGTQNIQRIIEQYRLTQQAIYLPPPNLQKVESSLIFIPQKPQTLLPQREENNQQLTNTRKNGVFITPPGLALSKLFEQHIGTSFTRMGLSQIQKILPKLLVEDMEITEKVEIEMNQNTITIYLTKNILNLTNQEQNQSSPNNQIGNLLSSAIACILAKATRKPITIKQETYDKTTKTTTLTYQMKEE